MASQSALDLAHIDPPIWRVLISDTAYGPYTLGQLQGFISEGRVKLHTKIAQGDGAPFVAAETLAPLQPALRSALRREQKGAPEKESEPHNYLVVTRLSGGDRDLIHLLNSFGSFGEAMPGVYVLSSNTKLSVIQQALNKRLQARDRVLVVDATSNRLGWFNLGPEADVHLKTIWKAPDQTKAS